MTEKLLFADIDEPGLDTREVYERRGGYTSLRKALSITPEDVLAATGWQLRIAEDCAPTPAPSPDELRLIREADPHGFWTSG